jgi:hypothetical protein
MIPGGDPYLSSTKQLCAAAALRIRETFLVDVMWWVRISALYIALGDGLDICDQRSNRPSIVVDISRVKLTLNLEHALSRLWAWYPGWPRLQPPQAPLERR